MATPEPGAAGASRAHAIIRNLIQGAGRRNLVILALFAVLVIAAGRTEPSANGTTQSAAPQLTDRAATAPPDFPLPTQTRGTSDAAALDNLLSRFDVLIRLLEARGVETGQESSALAELRALRERVYLTSRKALAETDSAHAARP